jgi:hypothetical protein
MGTKTARTACQHGRIRCHPPVIATIFERAVRAVPRAFGARAVDETRATRQSRVYKKWMASFATTVSVPATLRGCRSALRIRIPTPVICAYDQNSHVVALRLSLAFCAHTCRSTTKGTHGSGRLLPGEGPFCPRLRPRLDFFNTSFFIMARRD